MTVRVVHVVPGLEVGGAETVLARLVERAGSHGVESVVISIAGGGPVADRIRAMGVPVSELDLRTPGSFLPGFVRLVRLLRRLQPAVVQTWMYHGDLLGGLAARLAGVKTVVWNLRMSPLPAEMGPRMVVIIRLSAVLSRWVPARIVACADAVRDAHVRLGYGARAIVVIPNGFDTATPPNGSRARIRAEIGLSDASVLIGRVARFHPMKGHVTFLEAARRVSAVRSGVEFALVGLGMTPDNEVLRRDAARLAPAATLHLMGPRPDIPSIDVGLDVLCHSSSWGEGLPNAVGEAMAAGVAVVATDVGGTAQLVGDAGLVVPPSDPEALAVALLRMIDDRDERRRLGALARERIGGSFSLELMVDRYVDLYKDMVDRVRD